MGRSKNTIGNYVYQFGNLILPLLTMSFLSHLMSPGDFGYFAISQIIIAYANVATDYGSQISVVREDMSLVSDLKYKNSVFISTIFITKLLLFVISSSILLPFVFFYMPSQISIYFLILIVLTNALNLSWFFMMTEGMMVFGIINFVSKVLSMGVIFIYGNSVSLEKALTVILWGNIFLILGSYLYFLVQNRKYITLIFNVSVFNSAISRLKSDWPIFKTIAYGSLLSNSGSIILALHADPRIVGGYNMIEKIARGSTFGVAPLLQARIKLSAAQLSNRNDLTMGNIARLSAKPFAVSLAIAVFLCAIYASGILKNLFPDNIVQFSDNLVIFAVWIPLSVLNNILGIQILNNVGEGKYYSNKFLISTIMTVFLFFVIPRLNVHFGTAIAILMGETLLFVMLSRRLFFLLNNREI